MAKEYTAGVSTLGIQFGYALETEEGTKPSAFTRLHRINAIGGVTIDPNKIDASALEDLVTKYVSGRSETGDTLTVTINLTDDTLDEWNTVISTYHNRANKKLRMWFETITPGLTKADFVIAQPPTEIPKPQAEQNGLYTVEINLTIEEYKGYDTKVTLTDDETTD